LNIRYTYGLAISLLILSQTSSAELLDGQGIDFAGGKLSPELTVKESHDDNLTNQAGGEIDTFVTTVTPHLTYELKNNKNRFTADYLLEAATHNSSHNDDYIDQTVSGGYEYTPTSKISAGLDVEYYKGHDPRGTGAAEGTGAVQQGFDRYHHYKIEANAAYGAESAKGRFEIDAGHIEKDYENNRATTAVRDREDHYGSARLFYRVMPKTRLLLEGRVTEYKYDRDAAGTASLDSTTSRGLLGVTWDTTFKTTGTAQIGYIRKDFDANSRKDGEDLTWEVGVEWKPKSYSTFNLNTSRDFTETNGAGNFTSTDAISFSYNHEWSKRISTSLSIDYSEDSFDQDTTGRSDDKFKFAASVDYEMRRWLSLGAGYTYDERDSTINSFDYKRNIVEGFATVTF
jgi:polysaccharide biosynthesis protein VpsM